MTNSKKTIKHLLFKNFLFASSAVACLLPSVSFADLWLYDYEDIPTVSTYNPLSSTTWAPGGSVNSDKTGTANTGGGTVVSIVGQDGWVFQGGSYAYQTGYHRPQSVFTAPASPPANFKLDGNYVASFQYNQTNMTSRPFDNDFELTNQFRLGFEMYRTSTSANTFGLTADLDNNGIIEKSPETDTLSIRRHGTATTDEIIFEYGIYGNDFGIRTSNRAIDGTATGTDFIYRTAGGALTNETYELFLDVDLEAFGGSGSATLSYRIKDSGDPLTTPTELEDVRLWLENAPGTITSPEDFLGVYVRNGSNSFVDNLSIETFASAAAVPEPATLALWTVLSACCLAYQRGRKSRTQK